VGVTKPVTIALDIGDDGQFSGSVTITQSDWGIKPYSGLMGALKVADDVKIEVSGTLPG
jgi:polyisoprenoid-binding protein YceI